MLRIFFAIAITILFNSIAVAKTIDALGILSFEVNESTQIKVEPHKPGDPQLYTASFVDIDNKFIGEIHIQDFSADKEKLGWYSIEKYKKILEKTYSPLIWISAKTEIINGNQADVYIFDYVSSKNKKDMPRFKFYVLIHNNYLVRCYTVATGPHFEIVSVLFNNFIGRMNFSQEQADRPVVP